MQEMKEVYRGYSLLNNAWDETGGFILMLRLAEYLLMNGRTDHGSVILFKT